MNSKPVTQKFSLNLSPEFEDEVKSLDKGTRLPVTKKLVAIRQSGHLPKITKLTGQLQGLHHFRVGSYRVLLEIDFDSLTALAVGLEHRGVVYRHKR